MLELVDCWADHSQRHSGAKVMLILGDEGHYNGRFPWVTVGLVGINLLVFAAQCILGEELTNGFSLVPQEISRFKDLSGTHYLTVKQNVATRDPKTGKVTYSREETKVPIHHYPGPVPIVLTLFTSMFLHGGVVHLIGNMWFLVVFGRNIECAFDHVRFAIFYLACGIVGGLCHVASDPNSIIPCLGASGAIAGVLGAYLVIYPLNKVKLWIGLNVRMIELPAFVFIGGWFVLQYILGALALSYSEFRTGIAYWDHIGGFLSGAAIVVSMIVVLKWWASRNR